MKLLDESIVAAEEIDSLGHMNVRYYMQRMERANRALLHDLGARDDLFDSHFLQRADVYTRFRNEQFEGARLHALGGVLGLDGQTLRTYVEIRNPDTQESAASFIVASTLIDAATRKPEPLSVEAPANAVEIPTYAQPRSLTLDPINVSVTLEELADRIPEIEGGGMMSGRRSTVIEADDVDAHGWLKPEIELLFLPFSKFSPQQQQNQQGPPIFKSAEGHRIAWAIMETRNLVLGTPRLGAHLSYFNCDIAMTDKSRHSRRWAFDSASGELLGTSDSIGLCIDLDERRAVVWPDELRQTIAANLQPELA
ncbi:MAG: thioesterase family protein [Pseudomonadota bacterium]